MPVATWGLARAGAGDPLPRVAGLLGGSVHARGGGSPSSSSGSGRVSRGRDCPGGTHSDGGHGGAEQRALRGGWLCGGLDPASLPPQRAAVPPPRATLGKHWCPPAPAVPLGDRWRDRWGQPCPVTQPAWLRTTALGRRHKMPGHGSLKSHSRRLPGLCPPTLRAGAPRQRGGQRQGQHGAMAGHVPRCGSQRRTQQGVNRGIVPLRF